MYTIEAKRDNQSFNNISLSSPSLGSTGLGLRWTRTYLDIWWQSKDLDFRLENEIFVLFCFQKHIIRLFRCFANQCCDRSCQKWEKTKVSLQASPRPYLGSCAMIWGPKKVILCSCRHIVGRGGKGELCAVVPLRRRQRRFEECVFGPFGLLRTRAMTTSRAMLSSSMSHLRTNTI